MGRPNDVRLLNKSLSVVIDRKFIDLIMNKVYIYEDGCWEFTGQLDREGYGRIKMCCNPKHLASGSVMDNIRDRKKVDI